MRNSIQNLPLNAMTQAIYSRLSGNVYKLDQVTPFPVYDAIPDDLSSTRYDHIELAGFDTEPEPTSAGFSQYVYTPLIVVYSSYNGQKEIEFATQQINLLLASSLTLTGFSDVGSSFRRAQLENVIVEGETRVIRRVVYRRRWIIADRGR